jgi:hypothetical protein
MKQSSEYMIDEIIYRVRNLNHQEPRFGRFGSVVPRDLDATQL